MISTTATAFRRMMKKILPLIGCTLCFAGTEDSLTNWEDDEEQTGIDWAALAEDYEKQFEPRYTEEERDSVKQRFDEVSHEADALFRNMIDDAAIMKAANAIPPAEMQARAEKAYGEYVKMWKKWISQPGYDHREFVEWLTTNTVDIECWLRMGGLVFNCIHTSEYHELAPRCLEHIRRGELNITDGYFLYFESYILPGNQTVSRNEREIIKPNLSMLPIKVTTPNVSAISVSEDTIVFHYNGPEGEEMYDTIREAAKAHLNATPFIMVNFDTYLILWGSGKLIKMDIMPEYTP